MLVPCALLALLTVVVDDVAKKVGGLAEVLLRLVLADDEEELGSLGLTEVDGVYITIPLTVGIEGVHEHMCILIVRVL